MKLRTVPIPRKVSKSYNVPIRRKISAPDIATPERQPPIASRKISCPAPRTVPPPPRIIAPPSKPLLTALEEALDEPSESTVNLTVEKTKAVIPWCSVHSAKTHIGN